MSDNTETDALLALADRIDKADERPIVIHHGAAAELRRLVAENDALRADAERYRWLRENARSWSWHPDTRCYPGKTVGFAHRGTGYLDYEFESAIDAARSKT